jgi:hypothetical protein
MSWTALHIFEKHHADAVDGVSVLGLVDLLKTNQSRKVNSIQ